MKAKQSRVYTLSDPDTRKVRFVGCSSKDADALAAYDSRFSAKPGSMTEWKKRLHDQGKAPFVTFLEAVKKDVWQEKLIAWTKLFRQEGAELFFNEWAVPGRNPREERRSTINTLQERLAQTEARLERLMAKMEEKP